MPKFNLPQTLYLMQELWHDFLEIQKSAFSKKKRKFMMSQKQKKNQYLLSDSPDQIEKLIFDCFTAEEHSFNEKKEQMTEKKCHLGKRPPQKLAEQLRDNLARRKAQKQARQEKKLCFSKD